MRDEDYDDEEQLDFGQNDGDTSAPAFADQAAAFQPSKPGQPWLRAGIPPWHLWGNSQQITTLVQNPSAILAARTSTGGQLVKIAYGRPETWHWLFAVRFISGPQSVGVDSSAQIAVYFNLSVGIGRAAIQIAHDPNQPAPPARGGAFERFTVQWGPLAGFPRGIVLYSSQVLAPNRDYRTDPPFPNQDGFPVAGAFVTGPGFIDQVVAQDLQLTCDVEAVGAIPTDPAIGQPVVVEVSAQFAPKNHIRPDWFLNAPDEAVFAGAETGGK